MADFFYARPVDIQVLPEDLFAAAVGLWHECGLTRPWNDAGEDLMRAMRGPDSTVLSYVRGGELVGTAMVGHDGHRGWVYYLAVRENERKRGVGRALMRSCEEWTIAHGVPKLQLMVRAGNEPALTFYGRLGYETNDVVVLGRRLD
jgi:ribosomal protein S18 acetylase RimI-like enzyme